LVAGVEVVDEGVPKFEQSCGERVQAARFTGEHVENGEDDGFAVDVELDGPGRAGADERVDDRFGRVAEFDRGIPTAARRCGVWLRPGRG
jgi:hypothetical protein